VHVAELHVESHESPTLARLRQAGDRLSQPHWRAGQWAALGVIGFMVWTQVLFPAPIGVIVQGAINGAIFSLTALGIVLIYRANRIINFAQGDIGAVAGLLGVMLIAASHWPFFLAMAAGLVAALVLGALAEFLFVRRFSKAPRLILTVATLGIAQIFQGGELTLPRIWGTDLAYQINSTPLDFFKFKIRDSDPIIFGGSYLMAVVTVAVVTIALTMFFRYTRIGIAVRGSAESAERAGQLGIPVKRIGTLVWMIAAGLSALSLFLQAPIGGIPLGIALGPALLLRALAAAVIGRMENLGVTFAAAVGIGVMEHSAKYATQRGTLGDAIVFAIIMGAFFLQKRAKITRADDSGASSWTLIREVRPIPPELKKEPLVRLGLPGAGIAAAAALVVVPLLLPAIRVNLLFSQAVMFAIVGISLVVLTGWGGEVSLGQIAFFALGAATAAKLSSNGWDFFLCIIAAGLVGAAFSLVIGVPSLRIRGPFLAVATLGLALTTSSFFLDPHYFPWFVVDNRVVVERPILFGRFDASSEWVFYFTLLATLAMILVGVRSFRRSRPGRVLIAARDNTRAAQLYGISVVRARLWAFAMSGFIAAVAGAFFAFHQEGLSRTAFSANNSIIVFTLVVVGGLGSLSGALLGAAYYTTVQYAIQSPLAFLFVQGIGLLIILLVFPGGLGGAMYDTRDSLLRWLARRKNIVVASLLADRRTEDEMFAAARTGTANVDGADTKRSDDGDPTAELVLAGTPGGGS
jgi:branched-chain amino acid transport system permease protein